MTSIVALITDSAHSGLMKSLTAGLKWVPCCCTLVRLYFARLSYNTHREAALKGRKILQAISQAQSDPGSFFIDGGLVCRNLCNSNGSGVERAKASQSKP